MSNRISSPGAVVIIGAVTAQALDAESRLIFNAAASAAITLPADDAAGWPDEAALEVYVAGDGLPSFVGDTGVTVLNPGNVVAARGGFLTARRVSANTWVVFASHDGKGVAFGAAPGGMGGLKNLAGATFRLPLILAQSAVPMILPSDGTIGDNGALSGITALPYVYSGGAFCYFPADAIHAGSAAGWYWTVFSSGSAGTIYDNTYTNGLPQDAVPATPTPFVCTGPGAYAQTAPATITGLSLTIPGGTLGANGQLRVSGEWFVSAGTAAARGLRQCLAGATVTELSVDAATKQDGPLSLRVFNRNDEARQVTHDPAGYAGYAGSTSAEFAHDTAADLTYSIKHHMVTADANVILEAICLEVLPG